MRSQSYVAPPSRRPSGIIQTPFSTNEHHPRDTKYFKNLLASNHPLVTSGVKIGIGVYNKRVTRANLSTTKVPTIWTLVFHPTNLNSRDLSQVGIHKVWDPNAPRTCIAAGDNWRWAQRDPTRADFYEELDDPVGIIHIADIPWSQELLADVMESFEAEKNSDNPGGVTVWGPSAWVIRVIAYLEDYLIQCQTFHRNANGHVNTNPLRLPCSLRELHPWMRKRIEVLKATERRPGEVPVVGLDPEASVGHRMSYL